jgi:hypothetical protein
MIWVALVALVLALVGSIWLNIYTVGKNLELADQREALVDTIEDSLDQLETCYGSISHAADTPVLSDEPVIRQVLSDIRRAKNAVLAIAGKVVIYGDEPGDERNNRQ